MLPLLMVGSALPPPAEILKAGLTASKYYIDHAQDEFSCGWERGQCFPIPQQPISMRLALVGPR